MQNFPLPASIAKWLNTKGIWLAYLKQCGIELKTQNPMPSSWPTNFISKNLFISFLIYTKKENG
jgi:hypothetical protein